MSNTQRSLKELRKAGWVCQVVERWNAHAFKRQDLYGFCDILCMREGGPFLAVQVTSAGHLNDHVLKLTLEPRTLTFIACGGAIEIHVWKKVKSRWINQVVKYPKVGDERD